MTGNRCCNPLLLPNMPSQPNATYVGVLTPGTTSRMQADWLQRLLPHWNWTLIDTHEPFSKCPRWQTSLAFRLKIGPAVDLVNKHVLDQLPAGQQNLIWIGKGMLLRSKTVLRLRKQAERLIHYTPDTTVYANYSPHFTKTLASYDLAVTTKACDLNWYRRRLPADRVHLTTQAFDPCLHYPHPVGERSAEVALIGLCEPDRERSVAHLLKRGIRVRIGGKKWNRFLARHGRSRYLTYLGDSVFGEEYAKHLSECAVGLGAMTKRFPEQHTTRTFEIPACGALLATEETPEIRSIFPADSALYFDGYEDLADRVEAMLSNPHALAEKAARGTEIVRSRGVTYPETIACVLRQVGIDCIPRLQWPSCPLPSLDKATYSGQYETVI